ncbi:MAG TPA: hypothetical protein VK745_21725 [Polyangiaceae bacterium]|jgi:hypothetical protein|nr:hypothetical protein [Polyangiaceae bacterium]
MSLEDDVKQELKAAGQQFLADLWQPADEAVLEARAKDLVGLNVSAATATDPATKQAFVAAAKDVVNSVKILALIRAEAAAKHLRDQLEQFFVQTVVPKLLALLPALLGL